MSIYAQSNPFYVYAYLREDYTPYYIGKGKGRRYKANHKHIPIPKDKSRIIIIQDNLTELQSFILERYYIRWFGRKDNNTGILRNRTDGGEGNSGYILSKETKNKISQSRIGIDPWNKGKTGVYSDKTKKLIADSKRGKEPSNKGKTYSEEVRKSMGAKNIGRICESDTREKLSKASSCDYIIIEPNGNQYTINNLKQFCINNGLSPSNMVNVSRGRLKQYKGWKCSKIVRETSCETI